MLTLSPPAGRPACPGRRLGAWEPGEELAALGRALLGAAATLAGTSEQELAWPLLKPMMRKKPN